MIKDCHTIRPSLSDALSTCGQADLFGFHDATRWFMVPGWEKNAKAWGYEDSALSFTRGAGFDAQDRKERSVIR
jgi:hypothetical protein